MDVGRQTTADSWLYIGTPGILQGTYEKVAAAGEDAPSDGIPEVSRAVGGRGGDASGLVCRRALVIRPGALGDSLLTLPALQAIQAEWPQAEIDWMGNLAVLRWLPTRSVVHDVCSFEWPDLGALLRSPSCPSRALQEFLSRYDLVVSYAAPPHSDFAHNLARWCGGTVVGWDAHPRDGLGEHMSLCLQRPLVQLGLTRSVEPPRLTLTSVDREEAARWWADQQLGSGPVAAIHPGSGSPGKNWPPQRFAALAQTLQREQQARILLIQGEADQEAAASVMRLVGEEHLVPVRGLPLSQLAALLQRCSAYVGNDSGVSHLAAAVGVASLVIFGPTDPQVWAPRGRRVRVLRASKPDTSGDGGGQQERSRAIEEVTVEEAEMALCALVHELRVQRSSVSEGASYAIESD